MLFPLKWVSSASALHANELEALAEKMKLYYSRNSEYYKHNMGHEWLWSNSAYLPFTEIRKAMAQSTSCLEVGCGNAAILQCNPQWHHKYTGIDFSEGLLQKNKQKYPNASFSAIDDIRNYPFSDQQFDLVFSSFVIEHTVFPQHFLEECWRVLKPNGELIIFGPNFLDYSWMSSQRINSNGLGTWENLNRGRILDALSSLFYNRVLIPSMCRKLSNGGHPFLVNLEPTGIVGNVPFAPDTDAVYVTSFKEMKKYLTERNGMVVPANPELESFLSKRRLGFLRMQKLDKG